MKVVKRTLFEDERLKIEIKPKDSETYRRKILITIDADLWNIKNEEDLADFADSIFGATYGDAYREFWYRWKIIEVGKQWQKWTYTKHTNSDWLTE